MLALHFGAGNIGRGFIGLLLQQSGYEVCFADVNAEIVDLLNERHEYKVVLANKEQTETTVTNVSALNSARDGELVEEAMASADLITTAVGPNILSIIAPMIAKGLRKRIAITNKPLNIIACENMIGGSAFLKEKVYEHLTEEERNKFDSLYGFPNSAVDRIVPNQTNDDKLMVKVEPFFEWVIEQATWVGEKTAIEGATFVDDLAPYIERKLFTVNTGHAAIAYVGSIYGFHPIAEAVQDDQVHRIVSGALQESGRVLIKKYGFSNEQHQGYIEKIIGRFKNEYIVDDVKRVGRSPLRKLGIHDRLFAPALEYFHVFQEAPVYLCKVIAAALLFTSNEDQEAIDLQNKLKVDGVMDVLLGLTQLDGNHPIIKNVIENYHTFQKQLS
jgi:mannitol-1-phosphate 5-dehydrogenase